MDRIDRFLESFNIVDNCWVWRLSKCSKYGTVKMYNKQAYAHRVSYMIFKGEIPENYEIDHLCSNRRCMNPDHLEAVPRKENIKRITQRRTHCKHGHEFTPDNIMKGIPYRRCLACNRIRTARYKSKKV